MRNICRTVIAFVIQRRDQQMQSPGSPRLIQEKLTIDGGCEWKKTQLSEHMHLRALMISPVWLRDGEESLPVAWCPIEGHQMAPAHCSEA